MAAAPCPCCWQSEPASAGIAARAHSRSRVSSPVSRRGSAAHVAWWIISLQLCSSGRSSAEPVWSAPWWAKWRANPKTCVWLPAALKKEKSVFAALIRDLAFSFWGSVCSQTASTRWTRCRLNVLWGLNKEITSCSFSCARWDPQTSVLGWNKASFRCCFFSDFRSSETAFSLLHDSKTFGLPWPFLKYSAAHSAVQQSCFLCQWPGWFAASRLFVLKYFWGLTAKSSRMSILLTELLSDASMLMSLGDGNADVDK